jgi:hypothetical protein
MRYCSRCKKKVDDHNVTEGMTAGNYDVREGSWSQFADFWEEFVCDECMWRDPRYITVYGLRA